MKQLKKPTKLKHNTECNYYRRGHSHDCSCGADDYNEACYKWEAYLDSITVERILIRIIQVTGDFEREHKLRLATAIKELLGGVK